MFVALLTSLLLVREAAAAGVGKLDVSWQAPPGCPAYSDVESWLQAVIPPDARQRIAELHVKVVISGQAASGFNASVRVTRDAGPGEAAPSELRVVEGPACEEVARSAIVVVSVAMSDALKVAAAEPVAARPEPPPVVEPAPPVAAAAAPLAVQPRPEPPRDSPAPAAYSPPRPRRLITMTGGVGSGFGEHPGVRVDASLLFALGRSLVVGPHVHALPSVTIRRGDDLAELHFVAAGADLCASPELSPSMQALLCARAEAGFAWSGGTGSEARSDSGPVATLALSPGLSIGRRVRFLMQGDFELRVVRPRFETADAEVLAALPAVAASGSLGLLLVLP
jgi:hypothetical protein